ncbi:MAG: hypothetical protein JHC95_10095 [Solirubrobacteraceae bacterium]|nr:hypothetical protein [Solirubrobacteraceae bacterium]
MPLRKLTIGGAATAVLVAGAIAPQAAVAGGLLSLVTNSSGTAATSTTACPAQPTTKAFARWGDTADYSALAGGGFEAGTTGWQLNTSTTKIVADQDSYNVGGVGTGALELGRSASAASPAFCVDTTNPHFKFMVKGVTGSTVSTIIQYQQADGSWANALSTQQKVGAGSTWAPSDVNPLSTSVPGLTAAKSAKVRLWWINSGGTSRIDSVMVDPYRAR